MADTSQIDAAVGARPPAASIIVEWENVRTVGTGRAAAGLDELVRQIADTGSRRTIEFIIVCSAGTGEEADVEAMLAGLSEMLPDRVKVVAGETSDYYQQKNLGAVHAAAPLLLFIDSDVVPQAGWLRDMLRAASDPCVDVVGGATIVSCTDFYSRAMALIWIFPIHHGDAALVRAPFFHANNFAIPAALFASHRFRDTGQYRGQCGALADELRAAGYSIWLSQSARVEHPPPAGIGPFFRRAWRSGADEAIRQRMAGKGRLIRGTKIVAADLLWALSRVRSDFRLVGFGPGKAIAAAALAIIYYATRYIGFIAKCGKAA